MPNKKKVQIQLLDVNTGDPIEDVDPLTSAEAVTFSKYGNKNLRRIYNMPNKKKVQIQLLDVNTGDPIEDVDPLTSAEAVTFSDGETFQEKYDNGQLTGPQGARGQQGPTGATGPKGWCYWSKRR